MQNTSCNSLKIQFSNLQKKFYEVNAKRNVLCDMIFKCENEILVVENDINVLQKCMKVMQTLIEIKKEEVKSKIESLVTRGLRTIFERDDYRFSIEMEIKRNVMNAHPIVYSNFQGKEFGADVIDGHGGGLCDVISFILQVIVLLSFSHKYEKIIIADEMFKHVARQHLPNVAEFLTYLTTLTNMQMIFITHQEELTECADKVFNVSLNEKCESVIKDVTEKIKK